MSVPKLHCGDALEQLRLLPANSVHCVVTSPPYYGLRDYGTAQWDGGDAGCDHRRHIPQGVASSSTLRPEGKPHHHLAKADVSGLPYRDTCGKCGATRIDRQIGLEATPDDYLATMVAVFREVRRVLRDDGTCWVNIGDSYASNGVPGLNVSTPSSTFHGGKADAHARSARSVPSGLKPKDLLMMPARLALALQADGWWLRSDIIWHKVNPMPESVTDRPTSSHEHVFLLTKSARYFYDADAVAEPLAEGTVRIHSSTNVQERAGDWKSDEVGNGHSGLGNGKLRSGKRNLRNVWPIATSPYPGAHFAVMPLELATQCIKAGTSEHGCCASCGAPWVRQTERDTQPQAYPAVKYDPADPMYQTKRNMGARYQAQLEANPLRTTGWAPSCTCHGHFEDRPGPDDWISDETGVRKTVRVWVPDGEVPAPVPCTVLDPFAGAGTTGVVALGLGRASTLIELSEVYCGMAGDRIRKAAGLSAAWWGESSLPRRVPKATLKVQTKVSIPKATFRR